MLDIGEVAKRSGIPPSTLRYYEEIGLITSAGRHGLRRQFEPDVTLKLALITMGRLAGFSLTEIANMFAPDGEMQLPRQQLQQRMHRLDRQIEELKTLRTLLHHVADCPAPSHLECPRFRTLLKAAERHNQKKQQIQTS